MTQKKAEELKYLAMVAGCWKLKRTVILQLLEIFGSAEEAWKATANDMKVKKVPTAVVADLLEYRQGIIPETFWAKVLALKLEVVSIRDEKYPKLLKEIVDPPIVLYVKGRFEPDEVMVAVVGSRMASNYGYRMARRITEPLAQNGVTVVSGLALGIDGAAHKATLENGGRTIAILAHGLDIIYPEAHRGLANEIIKAGGAIISEYAPGMPPLPENFLARNRIIAGMSIGTVLVEAAERSGALTTARIALEEGRTVFAVPGDAERNQSAGVNNLIKRGACPVTNGEEVLRELNLPVAGNKKRVVTGLNNDEQTLFGLIADEPVHIDKLTTMSKLDIVVVNTALLSLELKGIVRNVGGMQFVRC